MNEYTGNIRLSRAQAIRKKCLSCLGSYKEVARCCDYACPLYRYRRGKEERDELYKYSKRNASSTESILSKKQTI